MSDGLTGDDGSVPIICILQSILFFTYMYLFRNVMEETLVTRCVIDLHEFFNKNRCVFRTQSNQNTNFVQNIQEKDETQKNNGKTNASDTKREESREEKRPSYFYITFFFFYKIPSYSTRVPFQVF